MVGRAISLLAAVGLPGVVGRSWAQEEKLPKAEEVLDRAIEALGGKAALEKIHNRVSKGSFEMPAQGTKGTVVSYEAAPNKSYTAIDLPGMGKVESGTDGEVYWELSPMVGARILEGEEKAFRVREGRFNAPLYWRELYKKAECVGTDTVDDHPCYKIVMTPEIGSPQTVYYDRKSYLTLKVDMTVKGPMGEMPVEVLIDDYKKIDGVMVPHKIVQRMMGMEQTLTLDRVENNVDIPADRFALPEAVKALLATTKPETQPASTTRPKP
jgi:hypothetical protein